MRFLLLSVFALSLFSCNDNAFSTIDTSPVAREYSTNASPSSGDPDEAVAGFIGLWDGALSAIDPDAPQSIRVMDSALDNAVLIEFGNGVIHTAFLQNEVAVLNLTGSSWRNAIEECPPTADLFVTLRLEITEEGEAMNIKNQLKTSTDLHTDTFIYYSK